VVDGCAVLCPGAAGGRTCHGHKPGGKVSGKAVVQLLPTASILCNVDTCSTWTMKPEMKELTPAVVPAPSHDAAFD
jgi:hypothetical protein